MDSPSQRVGGGPESVEPSAEPTNAVRDGTTRPHGGRADVVDLGVPGSAADARVPERWALFVKSLAFYPETNQRVDGCLERLVETLESAGTTAGRVRLVFGREVAGIGDLRIPAPPGSNLHWLRERLDRAALAGVEVALPVRRESLVAFAKQLLVDFTRPRADADFEELWPDRIEGVEPLPRRFGGVFDAHAVADGSLDPIAPSDAPETRDGADAGALLEDERRLLNLLSSHGDVADGLSRIQDALEALPSRTGTPDDMVRVTRSMDLIGGIVSLLSTEDVQDYEHVVELTTATLDAIADRLALSAAESAVRPESRDELRRLMTTVGTKLFGRQSPTFLSSTRAHASASVPGKGERRRNDAEIAEDLPSFYAELDALPRLPAGFLEPEDLESPAEELGAYLHFFVHLEDPGAVPGFEDVLVARLEAPDPESAAVLRQYTDGAADPSSPAAEGCRRVVDLLHRRRLTRALRQCGLVGVESACAGFPDQFVEYLEALDDRSPEDMEELGEVCGRLGHERIAAASHVLVRGEGLLKRGLAKRVLAHPRPEVMPLAWVVLHEGRAPALRAEVVRYLRRFGAGLAEFGPVDAIDREDRLPDDYLLGLLAPRPDGSYPAALHSRAAAVLADFVEHTKGEERPARLKAIRALGRLSSPDARCALESLAKGAVLGLLRRREPRRVRKLAKEVLRAADRGTDPRPTNDV